jgi:hypothetical protein
MASSPGRPFVALGEAGEGCGGTGGCTPPMLGRCGPNWAQEAHVGPGSSVAGNTLRNRTRLQAASEKVNSQLVAHGFSSLFLREKRSGWA